MLYSAEHVNRYIRENRFDELIAFSEARHQLQFEMLFNEIHVADMDCANDFHTDVVMVTGPSSSGKTTFSNLLARYLTEDGYNCTVVSIDDYYLNRETIMKRQLANGRVPAHEHDFDYETLDAFDVPFFKKQMRAYLRGEEITLPSYNFTTGKREIGTQKLISTKKDMIIVEGIHALNPELIRGVDFSHVFKVYICPFDSYTDKADGEVLLLPRQIRFMRRAIRDHVKRGSSLLNTMGMWPSVRNGEEKYIKPVKKYADFFFNSSFEYEIAFLKAGIGRLYERLTLEEKEEFEKFIPAVTLRPFLPKQDFEIPADSIFNEFFMR